MAELVDVSDLGSGEKFVRVRVSLSAIKNKK